MTKQNNATTFQFFLACIPHGFGQQAIIEPWTERNIGDQRHCSCHQPSSPPSPKSNRCRLSLPKPILVPWQASLKKRKPTWSFVAAGPLWWLWWTARARWSLTEFGWVAKVLSSFLIRMALGKLGATRELQVRRLLPDWVLREGRQGRKWTQQWILSSQDLFPFSDWCSQGIRWMCWCDKIV